MPAVGVEPSELGQLDKGAGRDERTAWREQLCLARMPHGRWCTRLAGHHDFCASHALPRELPRSDFMPKGARR